MKRTTIFLTEDQIEKLRQLAFIKRTSMSQLICDAVTEVIEDEENIREGLQTLADERGTLTWAEYQRNRKEKRSKG